MSVLEHQLRAPTPADYRVEALRRRACELQAQAALAEGTPAHAEATRRWSEALREYAEAAADLLRERVS